ncbi:hypothetical protein AURANDRAFT_67706 [Aureococcus anophagefferens]|uniref:Uncharacterized protein n=1 Tax=Aureococcus anophagefferens TaxID=44056 RepID=F0YM45_AURAN|nr:hypothetical protein AURANDRAFT_67706 [Aureococcus anophagefferens]EGB03829.1 hypothetical protein AURANDRAFT_67706 [Aureococcus anophagefferens]|eukprot:XP_009041487.1 hypothetical protein AURANDRAFT_67706 [Aureococcus anophagefferens]
MTSLFRPYTSQVNASVVRGSKMQLDQAIPSRWGQELACVPLGLAWEALQNRWKTRQDWSRRAFTHRHSYTSLDFVGGIQTATSHSAAHGRKILCGGNFDVAHARKEDDADRSFDSNIALLDTLVPLTASVLKLEHKNNDEVANALCAMVPVAPNEVSRPMKSPE